MNYIKAILTHIEDLTGFKEIVGASEEIASMKMRSIRNKVLLSRDLNIELTDIYREVSTSYKNQIMLLVQDKKGQTSMNQIAKSQMSLKTGNGEHACVYLSANSGLFSKILERTYHEFMAYLDEHKEATPIIIGEYGKTLFLNEHPDMPYIFYPLAEGKADDSSLKQITEDLSIYSSVVIFYAKFETMASQTTTILDVSGQEANIANTIGLGQPTQEANKTQQNIPSPTMHYLFEPSLEKIILFFETEIFFGIIQQTVTESELARYASRITTLDMARENIDQQLKAINLEKRFATHRLMNKKQNEAITGISLWKLS
jgi:F0F1-type ATP synthase gamma subunit